MSTPVKTSGSRPSEKRRDPLEKNLDRILTHKSEALTRLFPHGDRSLAILASLINDFEDEPFSAGKVRSALSETGARALHVILNRSHPVVRDALVLREHHLRFLIALFVVEWCQFWHARSDAQKVREFLINHCKIIPKGSWRVYWNALASAFAASSLLAPLDQINLSETPQEINSFTICLRQPSDVPAWRALEATAQTKA